MVNYKFNIGDVLKVIDNVVMSDGKDYKGCTCKVLDKSYTLGCLGYWVEVYFDAEMTKENIINPHCFLLEENLAYATNDVKLVSAGLVEEPTDPLAGFETAYLTKTNTKELKRKVYNIDVKTKLEYFDKFTEFIKNQLEHGGVKYALEYQPNKEATDWICELVPGTTGIDWILGDIAKYISRYKNFLREKDLFKIATYAFIIWLKHGWHLEDTHDEDIKKQQ